MANSPGLSGMGAFTKFDPIAFLESADCRVAAAKAAKVAKVLPADDPSLATLATLAAGSPASRNSARSIWRGRLATRALQWFVGDRSWSEARRLAWGDLQNEWHEQHGQRWPAWQCAGCDKPIGGLAALDLPDGNRVHFLEINCLISFGRRWRSTAQRELAALGLEPP